LVTADGITITVTYMLLLGITTSQFQSQGFVSFSAYPIIQCSILTIYLKFQEKKFIHS